MELGAAAQDVGEVATEPVWGVRGDESHYRDIKAVPHLVVAECQPIAATDRCTGEVEPGRKIDDVDRTLTTHVVRLDKLCPLIEPQAVVRIPRVFRGIGEAAWVIGGAGSPLHELLPGREVPVLGCGHHRISLAQQEISVRPLIPADSFGPRHLQPHPAIPQLERQAAAR